MLLSLNPDLRLESLDWELWRAPVIQLLGGRDLERLEGGGSALRCTMSIGRPH